MKTQFIALASMIAAIWTTTGLWHLIDMPSHPWYEVPAFLTCAGTGLAVYGFGWYIDKWTD